MPYTSLLGLSLPTTGTLSGTWGDEVNNAITSLLDSAVAGTTTISTDADVTLTTTDGVANQARSAVILWTAGGTVTRNITAPARSKAYVVINATSSSQSIVIRGTGPTTGVTVVAGKKALVAWNGTDFVQIAGGTVSLTADVTGTLPVGNGGTGAATLTLNNVLLGNGTSALQVVAPGANGNVLTSNGTTWTSTTPAAQSYPGAGIPVSTGTAWSTSFNNSGTPITVAYGGTGAATLTGVLKGNGTSAFTAATAGTDYVAPATATTFTALQTFSGSASVAAAMLTNAKEVCTVSATAATGTINYDVTTQSVLYYTSSAAANWTVNFRGSSGTSLNTLMNTGESITTAFLVTQGGTAYYNSAVQVDGASVTPKWQGGSAPTAGNASSIDVYTYTIVKTGSAAFTIFATQTKFA